MSQEDGKSWLLTGSHAYGCPTRDSDVDVVLYCEDREIVKILCLAADAVLTSPKVEDDQRYVTAKTDTALRFGRLNVLIVTNADAFDRWSLGTSQLKAFRPVQRETAVAVFDAIFDASCDASAESLAAIIREREGR